MWNKLSQSIYHQENKLIPCFQNNNNQYDKIYQIKIL